MCPPFLLTNSHYFDEVIYLTQNVQVCGFSVQNNIDRLEVYLSRILDSKHGKLLSSLINELKYSEMMA